MYFFVFYFMVVMGRAAVFMPTEVATGCACMRVGGALGKVVALGSLLVKWRRAHALDSVYQSLFQLPAITVGQIPLAVRIEAPPYVIVCFFVFFFIRRYTIVPNCFVTLLVWANLGSRLL